MSPFKFLRLQMSESDGTPSNNRVMLFLLLTTFMLMIVAAGIPSIGFKLPEIPSTLKDVIEWLSVFLITGGAAGKVVNAYKETKGVCPDAPNTPPPQGGVQ